MNKHLRQQITEYELKHNRRIDRRAAITYDVEGVYTYLNQSYTSFSALIKANKQLLAPGKTPIRLRDPELTAVEQQLSIRIYKYGVTRTNTGWRCRSEDQVDYLHAPTLYDLLELAPHCFASTAKPPKPSKQVRVPKIKEVVAKLKEPSTEY